MKLHITSSYNGASITGECVMLHRYGDVYPCIDNLYHPNPGTEEDEYSEIERPVDWLLANNIGSKRVISRWMAARMSQLMEDDPDESLSELVHDIMYDDGYTISPETARMLFNVYKVLQDPIKYRKALQLDELEEAREIATFINEYFLRVRAGGKLNPEGANAIYFRISSHGYDWHSTISNFLWDTFGSIDQMPSRIWIGHDAETNPPEITLFDGTPDDFFDWYDSKIAASTELK